MHASSKIGLTIAAAALALTTGASGASAHKHHHDHAGSKCYPVLEGRATGQGLFGKGTEQARAAARYDWESKSTNKYGFEYGNFDKSWGQHWDCKKGAILKAKCVVTARPCHQ
jgi:uncharacterized membrane protein